LKKLSCLKRFNINAEICGDDPLALVEGWDGSDDVVVVDATVTGAPVGTVQVWNAFGPEESGGALWASSTPTIASTHGLGVGEAIRLAQALHRLPRRLRVYGIEGKQFEPGAEVSQEVIQAVERVVQQIAEWAVS
jgi:hydrogenase maturation protease